jgi:hypothetical protein
MPGLYSFGVTMVKAGTSVKAELAFAARTLILRVRQRKLSERKHPVRD